ncbi:MAG: LysE family translocator [Piscinibacter sp.]
MQSIDHTGGFIVAILVFQLIPGPGTLAILRATSQYGMKAGFASVSGTLLGGLLCMLAAASGLEAVFRGSPGALHLLQTAGSLYLAWMGWRLIDNRAHAGGRAGVAAPGWGRHLRQALAISLTNPKVILFYFALLPLFFRAPITAESLGTMVACVSGISLIYQGGLVVAGHAVARRLGRLPSARRVAQRAAGLCLIAFAAKLLFF